MPTISARISLFTVSTAAPTPLPPHDGVAVAGGRGAEGGLGVDTRGPGPVDEGQEVGAEALARGRYGVADGLGLAQDLVGVEQRGQAAGDAVHHAGPPLLDPLDL